MPYVWDSIAFNMTKINESELLELHNYKAGAENIESILLSACANPESLVRFMARYTTWNALFGCGVATLAGKIGRCSGVFRSPDCAINAISDRSIYVASFFFDAARDEFDDRGTLHRDTHRCLAQSTLQGIIDYFVSNGVLSDDERAINSLAAEPLWLKALSERIAIGYGMASSDHVSALFRSMGYHLGSELLADQEFSVIDRALGKIQPELTEYMKNHTVEIAGQQHNAYQWIAIHSGYGGGAEADHFNWAVKGVNKGFGYIPAGLHEPLRHQLHLGFLDFVSDHSEFFLSVNQE